MDKAFEGCLMAQHRPKERGGTVNCPACGPKSGKANHNAVCRQRCDDWVEGSAPVNQKGPSETLVPPTEVPRMRG